MATSPTSPTFDFSVLLTEASRGTSDLSLEAVQWLSDRLTRYGYLPELCNFGGLCCLRGHVHGSDGLCAQPSLKHKVYGKWLCVFPTPLAGLSELIRTARGIALQNDVELWCAKCGAAIPYEISTTDALSGEMSLGDKISAGFRFCKVCYKVGSVIGGVNDSRVDGYRSIEADSMDRAESIEPDPDDTTIEDANLGQVGDNVGIWPFDPSEEAEARVRDAASRWVTLTAAMNADPKLAKVLRPFHDHWITFYDNWRSGKKDETDLRAIIAEVNSARAHMRGGLPQDDPGRVRDIRSEDTSVARKAAEDADSATRSAMHNATQSPLLKWMGAGAAIAAAAAIAIKGILR